MYDYDLMIEHLVETDGMDNDEAIEFIDYNTIRSLPYYENAPIIVNVSANLYLRDEKSMKAEFAKLANALLESRDYYNVSDECAKAITTAINLLKNEAQCAQIMSERQPTDTATK